MSGSESMKGVVTDKYSVGIVIVNFNGGQLILDCIDSVLSSNIPVDIVVADNGSSDGSLAALQRQYRSQDNVSIVVNGSNLGFAAGSNRAFHALGEACRYILFLNPDCKIDSDTVQNMVSEMTAIAGTGMAGCLILNEDGSEQRGCRRHEPTPLRALSTMIHLGKHVEGVNRVGEILPENPVEVDAISGAFMLTSRTALKSVGLMDEHYFLHCEDLDWCKRFRQQGWKVVFVPHVCVTHFKGGSSNTRRIRVEWHKHRGMLRYYRKFYADKHPFYILWAIYLAVTGRFILMLPQLIWNNLRG